jgi:pimeloyl-ACP methyl ester carboxylesterase
MESTPTGTAAPFRPERCIFLHGLEGSSQGTKAQFLRQIFPPMHIPDFSGDIDERMAQLAPTLGTHAGWTIIGSSFGGLMGALWTCAHPERVRRLILLAPALDRPPFGTQPPSPVAVPTTVYHGTQDDVVSLEEVRRLAEQVFTALTFHVVDDDHQLRATVAALDWQALVG